jgi:hypothetical protein
VSLPTRRDIPLTARVTAHASRPFVALGGTVFQAHVTLTVEQPEPAGIRLTFCRTLVQTEQLIAQLQAALAEARALPVHEDGEEAAT